MNSNMETFGQVTSSVFDARQKRRVQRYFNVQIAFGVNAIKEKPVVSLFWGGILFQIDQTLKTISPMTLPPFQ